MLDGWLVGTLLTTLISNEQINKKIDLVSKCKTGMTFFKIGNTYVFISVICQMNYSIKEKGFSLTISFILK